MFHPVEHKLFLLVFCGFDVPHNVFESTKGINYEYFTPLYHNLAEIIRANFFPSQNNNKLITFSELKLMY